ncbi:MULTISPECIES: hypothetical protein [unclassified Aeromonas]|uniref:hypothetical protein n=1 Tax=unclassified Aeromonas TaxID=257493 RepID=UPI003528482F
MAISAQDAARNAADYFRAFTQDYFNFNISVEEVERETDYWLITLSFAPKSFSITNPAAKEYKQFKVDLNSGEVLSMKIRTLK